MRGIRFGLVSLLLVGLVGPVVASVAQAAEQSVGRVVASSPALQEFPPGTPVDKLPMAVGWGDNDQGELGDGTKSKRYAPVRMDGGSQLNGREIADVDAGELSSCVLSEGSVYCTGDNTWGQLGNNSTVDSAIPVKVLGAIAGLRVTSIAVGREHACAVADRDVYCWGNNTYGQLGTGDNNPRLVATKVNDSWVASQAPSVVVAGRFHTCVIVGVSPYCWGLNTDGQLGDQTKVNRNKPASVYFLGALLGRGTMALAAGNSHTCASSKGVAICWGKNNVGQLGTGNNTDSMEPVLVNANGALNGKTVKAIASGGDSVCVIAGADTDRGLYCWGEGSGGQLGLQALVDRNTAGASQALTTDVSSVAMGSAGGCAIRHGLATCWGDAAKLGRIGDNKNPPQFSQLPRAVWAQGVLKGRTALTVSTDFSHSLAVAVTTPEFSDVPQSQTFHDEITWLAGTGITSGFDGENYQPGSKISRQAMAAFLYRHRHQGLPDPTCAPNEERIFVDVPASSPFCGAIEWLKDQHITGLLAGSKFQPTKTLTRDTMSTWLANAFFQITGSLGHCQGNVFSDVTNQTQHCANIEAFAMMGVTSGYGDGTFKPSAAISRAAMAAFLQRISAMTTS